MIRIQLANDKPPIDVASAVEMDEFLDRATQGLIHNLPVIISITVHGHALDCGLGLPEGFVQIQAESGESCFVTVGDTEADGIVEFYLFGTHHTEIPRRHLIPAMEMRQVVREFVETGVPSSIVAWEQV